MRYDRSDPNEHDLRQLIERYGAPIRWRRDYEDWLKRNIDAEHHQTSVRAHLVAAEPDLADKRILDLGAGFGGLTVRLLLDGASVVAVEIVPDYCRVTRLRGARHGLEPPIARASALDIPAAGASADVVVALELIEHVDDPERLLTELRRVLRPDGVAIITAPGRFALRDGHYHMWFVNLMPRSWGDRVVRWRGRDKPDRTAGVQRLSEMHYYTWRGFKALLESQGFTVEDLIEKQLRHGPGSDGANVRRGWRWRLARVLRRFHLDILAYRVWRGTVATSFTVAARADQHTTSSSCQRVV